MRTNDKIIITISRLIGSGGSYIGQQLAQKLGLFYADREIIRKAAEQLSVKEGEVEKFEESRSTFWNTFLNSPCILPEMYIPPAILIPTDQSLFVAESAVIQRIAKEHSAVIIGRCGFHILRDNPNRISVFLHADRAYRVARYAERYHATGPEADKAVTKFDKQRAEYCRLFTGCDSTDARNYDLSIDTSRLDNLDQAVDLITSYVGLRRRT